ncbi:hypothetical protein [Tunturiibacter gelidoferens]|uniref:Uncharacterized protein n=1 Tax=Tunturiibacter gelidiferens TaxID=3069689 RepID=A0A9X0QIC3_9BACT|nr:hypothetical protein [Edaphobacter lichenicola]MBB5330763.1 hypothetical protein [Edaphobacter lichenicola]
MTRSLFRRCLLSSLPGTFGVFLLTGTSIAFAGAREPAEPKTKLTEGTASVQPLPDAPFPALISTARVTNFRYEGVSDNPGIESTATAPATEKEIAREQLTEGCETGRIRGKACKVHWWPILGQSFEFLTAQHSGNILLDSETRHDLTTNPYWSTYVFCVEHYRWYQWSDDTTFIVHDVGHPMMGAIVSSIFEQNDPKARALVFENNGNYWRSRLKAMAYSAVYSAQWKVGPVSEASIGNSGRNTYYVAHLGRTTNETGFQDFVITPVYGFGWNVGEDAIDRYIMPKIHEHVKNRFYLTTLFWMTPCKSAANLLRWKPTYYRDKATAPAADSSSN